MLYRLAAFGLMLLAYGCGGGGTEAPAAPLFLNEFPVNQSAENDDFVLTVESVSMTDRETLVYLHLVDKLDGPQREFIGNASITAGDLVLSGNLNPNKDVQVTSGSILQDWVLKFPALPKDTKEFALGFPMAMTTTTDRASIPIQLPEPLTFEVNSITLDQVISIQGRDYLITTVAVAQFNVSVSYEPVDSLAASHPLTAPLTEVTLHDDQGNIYQLRMADTSFDSKTGTLRWEFLNFRGMPSSKAKMLTLEIDGLGRMAAFPEPLPIAVPE